MNTYYIILGVNENSSLEEIKKAFRQKAKEFHPDVSKNPNAHAEFIKINEAYDFIINQKLGLKYNNKKQSYQSSKSYKTTEDWETNERNKAYQRANYYSQRKYKDFYSSKYYKQSQAINEFGDLLQLAILLFFVVLFPLILTLFFNTNGLWVAIALAICCLPLWGPMIVERRWPNLKLARIGLDLAIPNKLHIWAFFASCFFLTVFFTIGFRTFIRFWDLMAIFMVVALFGYFFSPIRKDEVFALGIYAPAVMSLLLLSNYFISFNPVKETYEFHVGSERYKGKSRSTTGIVLENDFYSAYPSVRFFLTSNEIYGDKISYTTRIGILGYKVYTDREFEQYNKDF